MWNLVALSLDLIPGSRVVFLLIGDTIPFQHTICIRGCKCKCGIFSHSCYIKQYTYVAEEVFEVVASGIVVSIQNGGVEVLLLMISLPVVQL